MMGRRGLVPDGRASACPAKRLAGAIMSNITFILEHEEGHLLPTFPLARRLAARGHAISYIGLADAADLVHRQGFPFRPILTSLFPPGSTRTVRAKAEAADLGNGNGAAGYTESAAVADSCLGALVHGEDLAAAVGALQPDLFLASSLLPLHPLVLNYRFGVPVALVTPWLRRFPKPGYGAIVEGTFLELRGAGMDFFSLARQADPRARRLADITARLLAMPELILCPRELDLPRPDWRNEIEVYHVEPSLDLLREDAVDFPRERLLPDRRLLYCSFGSQTQRVNRETLLRCQSAVVEAGWRLTEWQIVLATGLISPEELPPMPETLIATRWVPQIDMLRRAELMITHGGLGTVKECIFHGVPMLAVPLFYDQPENAQRITYHALGEACDPAELSADRIVTLVRQMSDDHACRHGVAAMRERFLAAEESGIGVQRIEEILARGRRAA
jgi:zeaxanthin glucosyltransferase